MPVVPTTTPVITVSSVIEDTRRHLTGSHRVELNRLQTTLDSDDTSVVLEFAVDGVTRGSFIAIEDETMFVWNVDPSTKTAIVQRAQQGTTAAAHTSGAVIEVNPRFSIPAIRSAIKSEIRSWGPRLYQVFSDTVTAAADTRGYDLTDFGNFYNILEVHCEDRDDSLAWTRVKDWRLIRNAPTADFASGNAIILPASYSTPQPTINVTVAAPFDVDTAFANATDLVDAVGIAPEMADIAAIGAAWRLLSTQESGRTSLQDQSEPADYANVPPDFIGRAAQRLKIIRDARIDDESSKLRARYPMAGWG
jgi:hypothetical protein